MKKGRVYKDLDGKWGLIWYEGKTFRCEEGQSRKALLARAKTLGFTHLFDGAATDKLTEVKR